MKISYKNIGIFFYHKNYINIINSVKEIIYSLLLSDNEINIYLNNDIKCYFDVLPDRVFLIDKEDLGKYCDIVLSFGGDGTILTISRIVAPFKIPLIGVNKGSLGFLTQVYAKEKSITQEIFKILNGEYIKEQRNIIYTEIIRNNKKVANFLSLNEVACSRGDGGKMIETEVFINKEFVFRQRSDGIIIATPTGSTAYSLAAGGPILQTTLKAFTLVPICPQSMSNRPIVVKNSSKIEILITQSDDAKVYSDGNLNFDLQILDRLRIKIYKHKLIMLQPLNYRYFKTLRQKLRWGEQLI